MSYTLIPIAVDLQQISEVIGSKNQHLVDVINAEFGPKITGLEELFNDFVEESDGELTVHVAMIQLIMGEKYNEDQGSVYGYALEALCRHLGQSLPNSEWSGINWEWPERADDALAMAGIDPSPVGDLMRRPLPIALPKIKDFPSIGFMELAEIQTALVAFGKEQLLQVKDRSVRHALQQLREWLKSCVKDRHDLICFYY